MTTPIIFFFFPRNKGMKRRPRSFPLACYIISSASCQVEVPLYIPVVLFCPRVDPFTLSATYIPFTPLPGCLHSGLQPWRPLLQHGPRNTSFPSPKQVSNLVIGTLPAPQIPKASSRLCPPFIPVPPPHLPLPKHRSNPQW